MCSSIKLAWNNWRAPCIGEEMFTRIQARYITLAYTKANWIYSKAKLINKDKNVFNSEQYIC